MINRIIALLFLAFLAISSMFLFVIAVIIWMSTVLFDQRLAALHIFTCFWASIYTWLMPAWSISVRGRDKIRKDATYVVISNHQSQLDILASFRLFFHFKWVSKAEVFRLPFIGWNMTLNRYIKVKRGDKDSIADMMMESEKALNEGNSLFFFPEGSRSRDGVLKTFKPGAFILAKKLKLPLLPIAINGTREALPKHSLNFHGRFDIDLSILDEIPYERFADLSVEDAAAMARDVLARNVKGNLTSPLE